MKLSIDITIFGIRLFIQKVIAEPAKTVENMPAHDTHVYGSFETAPRRFGYQSGVSGNG